MKITKVTPIVCDGGQWPWVFVKIMETDVDSAPWRDDIVTELPDIRDGYLFLPQKPGQGTELNEKEIAKHPWPNPKQALRQFEIEHVAGWNKLVRPKATKATILTFVQSCAIEHSSVLFNLNPSEQWGVQCNTI